MQNAICTMQSECSSILSIRIHHLILFDFWVVFGVLGGERLDRAGGSLGSKAARAMVKDDSRELKVVILDQSYRKEQCQRLYS